MVWLRAGSSLSGWRWDEGVHVCVVVQLRLMLRFPVNRSPPDAPVHGISQTRILDWIVILFSRESSQPRDWSQVSYIAGRFFTIWATRKAQFPRRQGRPLSAPTRTFLAIGWIFWLLGYLGENPLLIFFIMNICSLRGILNAEKSRKIISLLSTCINPVAFSFAIIYLSLFPPCA